MINKTIVTLMISAFLISGIVPLQAMAAPLLELPEPGTMVSVTPRFSPAIIKGITVHADNPLLFDFIVDPGQENLSDAALKLAGDRLIRYFMAALTVPAKDLWVNLSPYEKNRTVNEALGQTDMGRDMLAQDYILKQLTASLIYPENQLGKSFWQKVYKKAQETYGTSQVPINTFNKVWIMADQAEVYQHGLTAIVTKSHLKVLLETDYLAFQKSQVSNSILRSQTQKQFGEAGLLKNEITKNVIREIIIPELEKEVNQGKNFAILRQIFNAIILAGWYKHNLKESLLNQEYADKKIVQGIDIADTNINKQIVSRYMQAYKKGVFNYVKQDVSTGDHRPIRTFAPRKYFSGGVDASMASNPKVLRGTDSAMSFFRRFKILSTRFDPDKDVNAFKVKIDDIKKRALTPRALVSEGQIAVLKNLAYHTKDRKKRQRLWDMLVKLRDDLEYLKIHDRGITQINKIKIDKIIQWLDISIKIAQTDEKYKPKLKAPVVFEDTTPHDYAMSSNNGSWDFLKEKNGGIDLKQALDNATVTKDGLGARVQIDSAMIKRVKREGIQSLTPVIFSITTAGNSRPSG